MSNLKLTPDQAKLAAKYNDKALAHASYWYTKYSGYGYDAVYDAAIKALIKCARTFDSSQGSSFPSYLRQVTEREMYRIVRDANKAKRKGKTVSFDEIQTDSEEGSLYNLLGVNDSYKFMDSDYLRAISTDLSSREKKVLLLYFADNKSQPEIASLIGVSQMQVSRIIRKALAKMQDKAKMVI